MAQGGLWGTSTGLDDAGMLMSSVSKTGSNYQLQSTALTPDGKGNGYLILASSAQVNADDKGHVFFNQHLTDNNNKNMSGTQWQISSVQGKTNVYTIKCANQGTLFEGSHYLTAIDDDSVEPSTAADGENSQWQFVTLAQLKDDFLKATGASVNTPVPASFMLKDAGFFVGHSQLTNWSLSGKAISLDTNHSDDSHSYDAKGSQLETKTKNLLPVDANETGTKTQYIYTVVCRQSNSDKNNPTFIMRSFEPLFDLTTLNAKLELEPGDSRRIDCTEYGHDHTWKDRNQVITLTSINEIPMGYTYHIGNGYVFTKTKLDTTNDGGGEDLDANNGIAITTESGNDKYWQRPYGKYWTANIHGESGTVSQTITPIRKGWYRVKCKGMSNDGSGYLFAYAGTKNTNDTDKYKTAAFVSPETQPSTYALASSIINIGITYEKSVIVYVEDNETLTFGAEVASGKHESWTCFDSFSLEYCGEGNDLIVDEGQEAIGYLNAQTDNTNNQTLRLKRALKTNQWNSIVLPVSLNSTQVKSAFGTNTKLAKLAHAVDNRIFFVSVDLSGDDGMEAGTLYIINPENAMPTKQKKILHRDITTYPNVEVEDYYTINQVSFTSTVEANVANDVIEEGASTDDPGMQMVGTYIYLNNSDKKDHAIPAKSYFLSNGHWMYTTSGVWSVKGLRGWIETGKKEQTSSKNIIFNIDGVDEEEVSTGIDGLFVDGVQTDISAPKSGIYSISGQKMSGTTSLPKGIYIVNGRKMIVK